MRTLDTAARQLRELAATGVIIFDDIPSLLVQHHRHLRMLYVPPDEDFERRQAYYARPPDTNVGDIWGSSMVSWATDNFRGSSMIWRIRLHPIRVFLH
jgi:hypothetical protein